MHRTPRHFTCMRRPHHLFESQKWRPPHDLTTRTFLQREMVAGTSMVLELELDLSICLPPCNPCTMTRMFIQAFICWRCTRFWYSSEDPALLGGDEGRQGLVRSRM